MASSSSAAYPVLFFTQKRAGDDKLWVFYWLSDESKFGIASFPDTVYEMDAVREMRDILGTMFMEGRTEIKQVNDEYASVCYAFNHSLELPRVDDATARRQRIDRLVKFFVDEALEKKHTEQLAVAGDNEENAVELLQAQMRIRELEERKRRGLAYVFARFVRHFIQRWGHRHQQSMAPGSGILYDVPMVGISVGLSRSGSEGGLMYFEVVEADPLNIRSGRGTCFFTGGGGSLDTLALCSLQNAHSAAKLLLRKEKNTYLDKARLHMNVVSTESANKSGPSGGLAGGMAFVSLARGAKIRPNCAMTGQVALYGAIVKVSGIAEKTKAACDARMQYLVLPELNRGDFEAIPAREKQTKDNNGRDTELIAHFVKTYADAVDFCFKQPTYGTQG